jgi:hypothetical protein
VGKTLSWANIKSEGSCNLETDGSHIKVFFFYYTVMRVLTLTRNTIINALRNASFKIACGDNGLEIGRESMSRV